MKKRPFLISFARYGFLLAIVLFGSLPTTAQAMDVDFYQSNDILYYDPSASAACTTVGAPHSSPLDIPSLSGSENAEKIWNFLTDPKQGLSDEQAAGVMGNIEQESGYLPDKEEGSDSAGSRADLGYGIVQWTFGRRTALELAAIEKGVPVSDLGFQLAYMVQESQGREVSSNAADIGLGTVGDNEWETLKKMKTVEDATVFWHNNFEASADSKEKVLEVRGGYARKAYERFSGKGVASNDSSSGGAGCTPGSAAGSGDLTALLLEYAHPEYYENNYSGPVPPPKPAYLDIATKLANEGKWVGGGQAEIGIPGIDCGGFVSILLTQSGMEPDYNFGLDMDRGSSNQEYGQLPWAKRNWKFLGNGGAINTSDLRPGDVAYSNGHTFIFVGQVNGFASQYASSSYAWWRAPMAGGGFETATSPDYVWYGRREGTPPAYGTTKMSDPIPAGNDVNPGDSVWTGGEG